MYGGGTLHVCVLLHSAMHVPVEARGQGQLSPSTAHLIVLSQGLSLIMELAKQAGPAGISLSRYSRVRWQARGTVPISHVGAEDQFFMLVRPPLCQLSHVPGHLKKPLPF